MKRRVFFAALAALPFVGRLVPERPIDLGMPPIAQWQRGEFGWTCVRSGAGVYDVRTSDDPGLPTLQIGWL